MSGQHLADSCINGGGMKEKHDILKKYFQQFIQDCPPGELTVFLQGSPLFHRHSCIFAIAGFMHLYRFYSINQEHVERCDKNII
jgi:hypothetical protein